MGLRIKGRITYIPRRVHAEGTTHRGGYIAGTKSEKDAKDKSGFEGNY